MSILVEFVWRNDLSLIENRSEISRYTNVNIKDFLKDIAYNKFEMENMFKCYQQKAFEATSEIARLPYQAFKLNCNGIECQHSYHSLKDFAEKHKIEQFYHNGCYANFSEFLESETYQNAVIATITVQCIEQSININVWSLFTNELIRLNKVSNFITLFDLRSIIAGKINQIPLYNQNLILNGNNINESKHDKNYLCLKNVKNNSVLYLTADTYYYDTIAMINKEIMLENMIENENDNGCYYRNYENEIIPNPYKRKIIAPMSKHEIFDLEKGKFIYFSNVKINNDENNFCYFQFDFIDSIVLNNDKINKKITIRKINEQKTQIIDISSLYNGASNDANFSIIAFCFGKRVILAPCKNDTNKENKENKENEMGKHEEATKPSSSIIIGEKEKDRPNVENEIKTENDKMNKINTKGLSKDNDENEASTTTINELQDTLSQSKVGNETSSNDIINDEMGMESSLIKCQKNIVIDKHTSLIYTKQQAMYILSDAISNAFRVHIGTLIHVPSIYSIILQYCEIHQIYFQCNKHESYAYRYRGWSLHGKSSILLSHPLTLKLKNKFSLKYMNQDEIVCCPAIATKIKSFAFGIYCVSKMKQKSIPTPKIQDFGSDLLGYGNGRYVVKCIKSNDATMASKVETKYGSFRQGQDDYDYNSAMYANSIFSGQEIILTFNNCMYNRNEYILSFQMKHPNDSNKNLDIGDTCTVNTTNCQCFVVLTSDYCHHAPDCGPKFLFQRLS